MACWTFQRHDKVTVQEWAERGGRRMAPAFPIQAVKRQRLYGPTQGTEHTLSPIGTNLPLTLRVTETWKTSRSTYPMENYALLATPANGALIWQCLSGKKLR